MRKSVHNSPRLRNAVRPRRERATMAYLGKPSDLPALNDYRKERAPEPFLIVVELHDVALAVRHRMLRPCRDVLAREAVHIGPARVL